VDDPLLVRAVTSDATDALFRLERLVDQLLVRGVDAVAGQTGFLLLGAFMVVEQLGHALCPPLKQDLVSQRVLVLLLPDHLFVAPAEDDVGLVALNVTLGAGLLAVVHLRQVGGRLLLRGVLEAAPAVRERAQRHRGQHPGPDHPPPVHDARHVCVLTWGRHYGVSPTARGRPRRGTPPGCCSLPGSRSLCRGASAAARPGRSPSPAIGPTTAARTPRGRVARWRPSWYRLVFPGRP